MELQKTNIIKKSGELFARYGIKSVTMDDIARELGISKKTLYAHFDSKNDLIELLIKESKQDLSSRIEDVEKKEYGGLEKLYYIFIELVKYTNESNSTTYWNFKKYYRELFEDFTDFISKLVDKLCETHIKEAQWDNFIIPNVEAKLFSSFIRKNIMELTDDDVVKITATNRFTIQKDFVYYNLRSIATPTGLEQLDKLKDI